MDCLKQRQIEADTKLKRSTPAQINSDATDLVDMNGFYGAEDPDQCVFTSTDVFDEKVRDHLPYMSSKIELVYNKKISTGMVPKEDIPAGDFLSIEEFIVMKLDYKKRVYHCLDCFLRCDCLV